MNWTEANRAHLAAAVARIEACLRGEDAPLPTWAGPEGARAALDVVVDAFDLAPFERDLLTWCFANDAALDPPDGVWPSFGRALATLDAPELRALAPMGPLRRYQLVLIEPDAPFLRARLRLDERVLLFLLGNAGLDARLFAALRPPDTLPRILWPDDERKVQAEQFAGRVAELFERGELPLANLHGGNGTDRLAVAVEAVLLLGLAPCVLHPDDLPGLGDLWEREARLADLALVLDVPADLSPAAARLAERASGLVLVLSPARVDVEGRPVFAVELEPGSMQFREAAWRAALADVPGASAHPALPRRLAATFSLDAPGIEAAVVDLVSRPALDDLPAAAWDAARRRARVDLTALAERVDSRAGWADLVLPPAPLALLRELVSQFRHRPTVHLDWGMTAHGSRGDGIIALFSGPSGVGKTLAAEVIANDLALDLWRIDLSSLVSKYIGETEKNLARVFDAAERGACVLLFDEADALFGRRTEVRDSHDRNANLEVSYLLQRLERYSGVAILTTNLRSNVDVAFQRRFRVSVEFPLPGAPERARMWARVFPPGVPTAGLDAERLGQLAASGAVIRNIALRAAFLAAEDNTPVTMRHVLRAARADYEQREQRFTRAEVAGWGDGAEGVVSGP